MESMLVDIAQILRFAGFSLDDNQPHISGERFLMMRHKLVLVGHGLSNQLKVIIKASKHPDGRKEIEHERRVRAALKLLHFASDTVFFPEEVYFGQRQNYVIWVTMFIPQEKVFVAHPLEEQFFTALRALEAQEAFHATTYEHLRHVKNIFTVFSSKEYLEHFRGFEKVVGQGWLDDAFAVLAVHRNTIDRYANHLVHTDFVPHNFRLLNHQIYLLDCSSVYFGNKYEGWARFLNYMLLHNPPLERLLSDYVRDNRGEDEYFSLRLLRVYKLGYLLGYYTRALAQTTGNLHELTKIRISFWRQVLEVVLSDASLPSEELTRYLAARDRLRSPEEKARQQEFAVA